MSEVGLNTDWRVLSPFDKRECLSLKEAAGIAGKSEATLRGWREQHGLGRRVGGGTRSASKVAFNWIVRWKICFYAFVFCKCYCEHSLK
jgi:hypothetical protein